MRHAILGAAFIGPSCSGGGQALWRVGPVRFARGRALRASLCAARSSLRLRASATREQQQAEHRLHVGNLAAIDPLESVVERGAEGFDEFTVVELCTDVLQLVGDI